jgi:subfamily B ATP-binding cassette protein MsbA
MYRAEADIQAVMGMVTGILPNAFRALYDFILIMIFMTWLDWRVTVVILIYAVPYTMIAQKIGTWMRRLERRQRARWQAVDAGLQEGVAGAAVVQTFGRRHHEIRRYVVLLNEAYRAIMRMVYLGMVQGHVIGWGGFLPWLKTQLVQVYFFYRVIIGELSYGSVFPIFTYMNRLANPIQQLIGMFQAVRVALVPAERILETLDVPPVVTDQPGAKPMPPVQGRVEFRNVSFAYEDGRPVLHDINFSVEPGKKIGIVGHSGGGKSTIVNLLLRLYDPTSGRVLVDGFDLRDIRMNTYQEQVGLVLQETYLFTGTIRENILFGQPGATERAVTDAARMADMDDFVSSLAEGYDTNLREGARLSGGQKQRIGVARAMIRNPGILILDEPTSSLDSASEQRVYRTLTRVGQGRTTFIVSHRMATIMDADEILVVEDGRIVERGSHSELYDRRGIYYDMYMLYFGLETKAQAE